MINNDTYYEVKTNNWPHTEIKLLDQLPPSATPLVQKYEEFASGRAIVRVYKKFAREITSKRVWRQIADRISRGLLVLTPIIQPDVIIFGGSVGTYYERYGEYLEETLKKHLPENIPAPKLVQAKHPEEAVVYGCYYYGIDYLTGKPATK